MSAILQQSAPSRNTPIRTIIEQNRERGGEPAQRPEVPWGVIGVLVLVGVAAAIVAWWLRRGARRARPAAERAFLKVCRKLALDRDCRALIVELAAACDEEPLALVVSPGTLRNAISRIDRRGWEQRKGWKRIMDLGKPA